MNRAACILISLISALSLLVSCASGGGTVRSGGNDGSSASGGGSSLNILALLAAVGAAWYLGDKAINSGDKAPPSYLPVLRIERPTDRHEHLQSTGYVIFERKADGLNMSRHMKFCRALLDKFMLENRASPPRSSMPNSAAKVSPTIWPIVDSSVIDMSDCRFLLAIYDSTYRNMIHMEYNLPQGQGPLLIAFNGRFAQGMAQDRSRHGIYWDASEYSEDEFPRLIDIWFALMARSPEQWTPTLDALNANERIRRTLQSFR